ncbi:hypothetical protein CCM_05583 [Cordyceps militaris CM01]|uniref:MARVEL domain-containing protein n=1 Tax=Cordyceps militaris (strain CM01) TaxID=983644 RepID=G3JKI6_CORMM|nr:uncharacterized protein CCM_05583 [Cordyceps militaris CM01]EGX91425.1 hypothetical protein CCM_05583 [Cordyceps militaris CM01]
MSRGTSLGLKTVQWLLRCVQLLCAVIVLGIYAYFLAALANHALPTPTNVKAVEGVAGVAAAYALLGLLLLCCLAGRTLASFAAMCLDFAFLCAYIFVAVANKGGAGSCTGDVTTVFGSGKAEDTLKAGPGFTKIPSYRTACKLQTACLSIAIIAIFFYIFSFFVELALGRNHHREKRLANSPPQMQMPFAENPYSNYQPEPPQRRTGFLGRVFGRGDRGGGQHALPQHDPNTLPAHAQPDDMPNRDSQVTAVGQELSPYNKYETGYGNAAAAADSSPVSHSPTVAGHTGEAATTTTYTYPYAGDTYTHAGDPYTHAGDHYGHAGDDYHYHSNAAGAAAGAHNMGTLPYPADDPYEPHRASPPRLQTTPRYPDPSHHYNDGIYDRP